MSGRGLVALLAVLAACESQQLPRVTFPQIEQARESVKGGIYGTLPTFALGGPDDANNRGVWIPTISTAQFDATLGKWFGASSTDLAYTFPNLDQFTIPDVGFMN